MADKEKTGKTRRLKSQPTFREKAVKQQTKEDKAPTRQLISGALVSPLRNASEFGKKEIHLSKTARSKNEAGSFWHKSRKITPRYFREAWQELKHVTWPGRAQAWKLTLAVFVFSIFLAAIITLADYGIETLFRKILL